MTIPAGSRPGRKLRLRGRGLPGNPAGDLYVVIGVALPSADLPGGRDAYEALAKAFPGFDPQETMNMAARQGAVLDAIVVEEEIEFTLVDLCRACGAERRYVLELVDEGVLAPSGETPDDWRFSGPSLGTARTALRLDQGLELGPSGAALVLKLLEEIDALRAKLRRAGVR